MKLTTIVVAAMVAMAAACFGARQPAATTGERAHQKAGPDVLVYVDNSILVPSDVMLGAKETASRMFAGIGLRVEWTVHPPAPAREPAGTGCSSVQPEVFVIRMTSEASEPGTAEALGYALPYSRNGTRITVFYGGLLQAILPQRRLASALLAHVMVHEITHVLQRVARHSDAGVMRAHWTTSDFADMLRKPLEFTPIDVALIRRGQAQRRAEACILGRAMPDSGSGQTVPERNDAIGAGIVPVPVR
jgi:hypothetical protein